MAKGAARFALMQKVKVTMLEEAGAGNGPEYAGTWPTSFGISVQQVRGAWPAQQVATVVPRAFGIKVVDRDDPAFKTDPELRPLVTSRTC